MKIAITGAAGIGKTTLSREMARAYKLELVEEGLSILNSARSADDFARMLPQILKNKKQLEDSFDRFVTDRFHIDLLSILLNQKAHKKHHEAATNFINLCIKESQKYDFVIIVPWGSFQLEQASENIARNMDSLDQMKFHSCLVGYCHMWLDKKKIIEIPQRVDTIENRMVFIHNVIQKRQPGLLATNGVSTL